MKKNILIALIISILSLKSYAQSTEIKPGSVLPQMTTAQRTALAAVNGMLVFDTNTQSYWVRRNGAWTEVPTSTAAVNFWQQSGLAGNEIKNTNTGGFWSANPVSLTGYETDLTNPPTTPVSGAGTRMMWIPSRSAFRVGTTTNSNWDATNIGLFSFAAGFSPKASGFSSTSIGYGTTSTGNYSTAIGNGSFAAGNSSIALGESESTGINSFSVGFSAEAIGDFSTAIGTYTLASGFNSTAFGNSTRSIGERSTAMGVQSIAYGYSSTAMGDNTIATANYSTSIGAYNTDNPEGLFMVGNGTAINTRYTAFIIRKDNSRVGIGEENPIAPLHVNGTGAVATGQANFFYPNVGVTSGATFTANLSIYAAGGIVSSTYIGSALNVIASDNRIKNIIGLSNNTEDLARLKKIEITNYTMRDEATWGKQTFKKVIAQQVESVYPEVIKLQTAVIPDIYSLAESVRYDAATKNLRVTLAKDYGIKVGDKIELVHAEKGKIQAEVIAVAGNTFTVKDWAHATDKIFVFGREVNDFRSVDYEALSMLGISAIQALAKENEKLRSTIDEVRSTNEEVRSTNSNLQKENANLGLKNAKSDARLDALEAAMKQLIPAGK